MVNMSKSKPRTKNEKLRYWGVVTMAISAALFVVFCMLAMVAYATTGGVGVVGDRLMVTSFLGIFLTVCTGVGGALVWMEGDE